MFSQTKMKLYLEKLNSYDSKHKVEKKGDQHNITDSFDGNYHTLNNVL